MGPDDLSPDAQLLLLIMAAGGGQMTKADAEAEFRRVVALPEHEFRAWFKDAQGRARTFAAIRRAVDGT